MILEAKNIACKAQKDSDEEGWHVLDGYLSGRPLRAAVFYAEDARDYKGNIEAAKCATTDYEQGDKLQEIRETLNGSLNLHVGYCESSCCTCEIGKERFSCKIGRRIRDLRNTIEYMKGGAK